MPRQRKLIALAVALVATLGVAACGDSGRDGRYCSVKKTSDGHEVCRTYDSDTSEFIWWYLIFGQNGAIQSQQQVYYTGSGSRFSTTPTSTPSTATPPASSLSSTGKAVQENDQGEPEGEAVDQSEVGNDQITDENTSADEAQSEVDATDGTSGDSGSDASPSDDGGGGSSDGGGDSGGGDAGGGDAGGF